MNKQVSSIKESEPEKSEYYFDITLVDGHISKIKVIKEMGEFVLVGDSRQHFCESELDSILQIIVKLNASVYHPSMFSDCDDESEETDDENDDDDCNESDY